MKGFFHRNHFESMSIFCCPSPLGDPMAKSKTGSGRRKTWREKLESQKKSKIVRIPPEAVETSVMARRFGTGKMLIPKPLDVDALIRKIPKGTVATKSQLRERLSKDSKADFACPLTTGIFIRIVAEAAEEDRKSGKKRVAPYWRVLSDDGALNDKFPGGVKAQARRLRAEGHSIKRAKGKIPPRVKDYKKSLAQF